MLYLLNQWCDHFLYVCFKVFVMWQQDTLKLQTAGIRWTTTRCHNVSHMTLMSSSYYMLLWLFLHTVKFGKIFLNSYWLRTTSCLAVRQQSLTGQHDHSVQQIQKLFITHHHQGLEGTSCRRMTSKEKSDCWFKLVDFLLHLGCYTHPHHMTKTLNIDKLKRKHR